MTTPRTALWGISLALGGSLVLSVNDMAVKALSDGYPLHEVVLIRALIGLGVVLAGLSLAHGPRAVWTGIRTRRPGLHAARVACVVLSNITYFLGLAALPLADGVAIFFVAPLLITALSVPFLGERVGPRRWAAVGAGLLGVIVMMRPGTGAIQPAALLVLLSALAYASMHILTRRMAATEGALGMSFWTQAGFVLVSCAMGLTVGDGRFGQADSASLEFLLRAWTWPAPADWPFFLATGLAVSTGGIMIAQAYRLCEAGLVAPFEYVAIPMAVVWGALVFGTWPDAVAWAGIALILGAGLYVLWRETRLGRGVAAEPGGGAVEEAR
ncbi:DMT family transporter [Rubellimicrobium roseum]|uniref:DMT family transporter n=1 Tax=Rubellimicrobium roseum TaxID=687525 RepID=A0A5C4N4E2_9RHOB|nr:DMT family transporter [Rubellimicrobium roseum]TNC62462.1 DMT family transporter [Rubellimicrobium roseum]